MIYSPGGRALKMLLSSPDGWKVGTHRLTHQPTKTEMWIGNGWMQFDGYDSMPKFLGIIERYFLYQDAKKMINEIIAQKMYQGTIGA